jgi:large subunit ribosomal protein L14
MVQAQTYLKIIDNTGVKEILCIRVLNTQKRFAKVGTIIIGAVKKVVPKSNIKKSEIVRVLLVRTRKSFCRANGMRFSFSDNAGILITRDNNPIGTRIFGPIAREIRFYGFTKVAALSSDLI